LGETWPGYPPRPAPQRDGCAGTGFVTAEMQAAAVKAGKYHSPGWNRDYWRLQILTIEQLLRGAEVDMPPTAPTFKLAPKAESGPKISRSWGFDAGGGGVDSRSQA
jgi:hypothetical protein